MTEATPAPARVVDLGPSFVAFWDYWAALSKSSLVPHLRDYLDHAPPDLQPNVVLTDVSSPNEMTIRLTGTALADVVGEMTGSHAERIYQGEARRAAIAAAWSAASLPCGYIIRRTVRSRSGMLFVSNGLVLPLLTDTAGSKTLAGYNELPQADTGFAREGQIEQVQEVDAPVWLDIGAGVPA
ncbi:MAG: PAS domain-containing protein [Alphaproteobacteria bacterium]|nr:PAS domain-containing protein [Alphaproteobacteria bacterium]